MARDDGVSLNQYMQTALAEKLAREQALQLLNHQFRELEEALIAWIDARKTDFDKRFKNLELEFRVAPKGRHYNY